MAGIHISPPVLNVLLALADQQRHGYGIMLEVAEFTNGSVRLGPGTLYGAIKRMLGAGLVEECGGPDEPGDDERRRYYQLTGLGQETLAEELAHAERTVAVGREKKVPFPKSAEAEA
jgi:DNA-binding PadR family transcriptional regulator